MLEKISVKTTTAIFLLCALVLALCACVNPVDIEAFFNDKDVKNVIEATKATVKIHPDSENYKNLVAGNEKITGLTPGKYYRVEEYDKEMVPKRNLYIKADGTNSIDFKDIGPLTEQQIVSLTNFYTYKVTSARSFDSDATYNFFKLGAGNALLPTQVSNVNGITTVSVAVPDTLTYYLDLSDELDALIGYEIMLVPSTTVWGSSSRSSAYYSGSGNLGLDSSYNMYGGENKIGLYQYQNTVNTGTINLNGKSLIVVPSANTTPSDYVFLKYEAYGNLTRNITGLSFLRVDVKQVPAAEDFEKGKLTQTYGKVDDVTITPKDGRSTGDITIYYEGKTPTVYEKSKELPKNAGTYNVTFDVAAATIYTAVSGLSAGTLVIGKATPTADDFDISNLTQKEGSVSEVIITPKDDTLDGAIMIYYAGTGGTTYPKSTTIPQTAGTYAVTFDVAASAANWNVKAGLSAGTLTVNTSINAQISMSVSFSGFPPKYTPNFTLSDSSFSQIENTFRFTLTLNNPGGYNDNDIKWYKGDDTSTILGSGVSITLNLNKNSNIDWWQEGDHYIYLVMKDTANVLPPQSGVIKITCNITP